MFEASTPLTATAGFPVDGRIDELGTVCKSPLHHLDGSTRNGRCPRQRNRTGGRSPVARGRSPVREPSLARAASQNLVTAARFSPQIPGLHCGEEVSKGNYFLQSRGKHVSSPRSRAFGRLTLSWGSGRSWGIPVIYWLGSANVFMEARTRTWGQSWDGTAVPARSPPSSMWSCSASDQDECRWQLLVGWRDGDGMEK
ncbi:hypothetical protein V8C26DRAFT_140821 [Trichoderma gracile]